MNTALSPVNAFALDSVAPAGRIGADACTLTLRPAMPAVRPAMGSATKFEDVPVAAIDTLRASVVPADGVALTITF